MIYKSLKLYVECYIESITNCTAKVILIGIVALVVVPVIDDVVVEYKESIIDLQSLIYTTSPEATDSEPRTRADARGR